jgi:hypothetical protein
MIDAGSSFIIGEEDPADVQRMRALLLELAQMLADEIGEASPTPARSPPTSSRCRRDPRRPPDVGAQELVEPHALRPAR